MTPTILVTGAARRVGAEIARCLHASGADVMIHYRTSATAAQALADALNANRPASAAIARADLDDVAALNGMIADTIRRFGRLDGLVNNASSYFSTPLGEIDEDSWQEIVASNLKGPLFLAQAAAPHLRVSKGAIVNIADIHAERPNRGYAAYCAAKAGLLGLTRALAVELAPEVRVNAVSPGAIQWPDGAAGPSARQREEIVEQTLLKRVGTPDDIARTVKFLLFDAPYVTGQVINVDGGRTAHLG